MADTECGIDCLTSDSSFEVSGSCGVKNLPLPDLDKLDIDIPEVSIDDVTTEELDGTGAFDVYMRAGNNQLREQYDKGRIKGAEYAASYIKMMELMMTQANMFVLKKFETEMAAALLPYQVYTAQYEAALKEQQAKKMMYEVDLICAQIAELKANGASERRVKASQTQTQVEQAKLYKRQVKGFDDKAAMDSGATLLDTWAVQAVEEPAAEYVVGGLQGSGANAVATSLKSFLTP